MPPATRSWATRASTTRIDEGRAPGALLQQALALTHARSALHPEAAEAGRPASAASGCSAERACVSARTCWSKAPGARPSSILVVDARVAQLRVAGGMNACLLYTSRSPRD